MDDRMKDSKKFPIYQFKLFIIGIQICHIFEMDDKDVRY